jgi:hypothetical protein
MRRKTSTNPRCSLVELAVFAAAASACSGNGTVSKALAPEPSSDSHPIPTVDAGFADAPSSKPACIDVPKPVAGAASLTSSVGPDYAANYKMFDLGAIPGIAGSFGGLVISASNPNTLFVSTNEQDPGLYQITVERGPCGHIIGFVGTASLIASIPNLGQSLVYGPKSVLFFPTIHGEVGQLVPNAAQPAPQAVVEGLDALTPSDAALASLAFVPPGTNAAGALRLAVGPGWFNVPYTASSQGFSVSQGQQDATVPAATGSGGMAYVPPGSTGFLKPALVAVANGVGTFAGSGSSTVSAFDVDDNGAPIATSARAFITGNVTYFGASFEEQTGDFLFGRAEEAGRRLAIVQGFAKPPPRPK